jgi:8-amino-7-oxononanoate synthase
VNRSPLRYLGDELLDLERRGLLRERPAPIDGPECASLLHLCSNDYLGYRSAGRLADFAQRAAEAHAAGSGASRLVTGEHEAHGALERAIAGWVGTDETLVFTSGYAANVGAIAALASEGDIIVSDALNHASIIDGCRLSRARCVVVPHNSLDDVRAALRRSEGRRRWVVTESYFSMEGDGPDLRALRSICDEHDAALVVDEAHAVGSLGPEGRGLAAAVGVRPDVLVGTLGKALGAQGAFVAGSRDLCRWLWNRARSFVFSTGLSPLLAAIGLAAVDEARRDHAGRARLNGVTRQMREGLAARGIQVTSPDGPILPIVLGSEELAVEWSKRLRELGVLVQAIRPPTVPAGSSRLRLTTRADLRDEEIERAVDALAKVSTGGGGRGA